MADPAVELEQHFTSSPEGLQRQRALFRAEFLSGIVIALLTGILGLGVAAWLELLIIAGLSIIALLLLSSRYPWKSMQVAIALGEAEVCITSSEVNLRCRVEKLREIELCHFVDGRMCFASFTDRLDEAYILWEPDYSAALEAWVHEVAAPLGVPVKERSMSFSSWNPRFIFLICCGCGLGGWLLWKVMAGAF